MIFKERQYFIFKEGFREILCLQLNKGIKECIQNQCLVCYLEIWLELGEKVQF